MFQSRLLAEAGTLFPPWLVGLFLSLKQPQSPERWGQTSQHGLRAIPVPLPTPSGDRLPACSWRGKNVWCSQGCWQRPHRLALESEPSGGVREVRTAPGERQFSSVPAPPLTAALPGPGQPAHGRHPGDAGELPLKPSTSLNSRCYLFSLAFVNVSSRDFWDSLVWSGSRGSWEKR